MNKTMNLLLTLLSLAIFSSSAFALEEKAVTFKIEEAGRFMPLLNVVTAESQGVGNPAIAADEAIADQMAKILKSSEGTKVTCLAKYFYNDGSTPNVSIYSVRSCRVVN